MMHISSFSKFMADVVNINQTRLDELDTNVDALFDALRNDDVFGPYVLDKIPQGSWPHETIIKPIEDHEFDADVLIKLEAHPAWEVNPSSYLVQLEAALARHGTYGDMIDDDTKSRCIRVIYANEHHVDLVPYRIRDDGRKVIVNRDVDDWEDTDPEGFTAWMHTKDKIANRNMRKVIRLLKYLRDHHSTFEGTPSVILTALVGAQVTADHKAANPVYYDNLPTALLHIVIDLDNYLQANVEKPTIVDPSGARHPDGTPVDFDHRWDQTAYDTFRNEIHDHTADIEAAYLESDSDKSVKLWQQVFGDGFPAPKTKKNAARLSTAAGGAAMLSASHRKPQGG